MPCLSVADHQQSGMAVNADIGEMAAARQTIDHCGALAVFYLVIEGVLALVVLATAALRPVAVLAAFALIALLVGQLLLVRRGIAGFLAKPTRAYWFLAEAALVFVIASAARRDGVLLATFALYQVLWGRLSVRGVRALRLIRARRQAAADPVAFTDWLLGRRPGLPSLRETSPRFVRALPWFILGIGLPTMLLVGVQYLDTPRPDSLSNLALRVGLPVAALLLLLGRRVLKLRASELRGVDPRAPVLLLRSFKDDKLKVDGRIWSRPGLWLMQVLSLLKCSLEEVLAAEARSIGPVLTVGEPHERLPRLGAARDYFSDEDWKRAVSALITDAALLVFVLSDTENLFWEFRTGVARVGKSRILLIVPPLRDERELSSRWQRFVQANADLLGSGVPQSLPAAPVVALFFPPDTPVLVTSDKRTVWSYVLALRLAVGVVGPAPSPGGVTRSLQTYVPSVSDGEDARSRRVGPSPRSRVQ